VVVGIATVLVVAYDLAAYAWEPLITGGAHHPCVDLTPSEMVTLVAVAGGMAAAVVGGVLAARRARAVRADAPSTWPPHLGEDASPATVTQGGSAPHWHLFVLMAAGISLVVAAVSATGAMDKYHVLDDTCPVTSTVPRSVG
jgi:hypothetical protein